MNDTMQIIRQEELGDTDVLKLIDVPIPEPGMGEIVVRVHAAGVNPVDVMARQSGVFVGGTSALSPTSAPSSSRSRQMKAPRGSSVPGSL